MTGIARIGDTGHGICPKHRRPRAYTTVFVSGAVTVMVDGIPTTTIGTIGVSSCGHSTIAITGSPDVLAEGSPVHRIGDMGMNYGPYTVTTGSSTVFAD